MDPIGFLLCPSKSYHARTECPTKTQSLFIALAQHHNLICTSISRNVKKVSSGSGSHKIRSAEFVPSDEDASSEDKVPSDDEEDGSDDNQGNQV